MIRTDNEYREAMAQLAEEKKCIAAQGAELKKLGLLAAEIKRVTDPIRSFRLQLQEEVRAYERLKRGHFSAVMSLEGIGSLLVSLRIARGLTQRQLAERLGVHESQISRDERNEYHGVTLDRAARILDVLGAKISARVTLPAKGRSAVA